MITRETDYALRLLRALTDGKRHSAANLAEGEQVPRPFAYKILKKLEKAKLVGVTRGAEGGWCLAADLEKTSLLDLMIAMEENWSVSACMSSKYRCLWREQQGRCSVHGHLSEIQDRLDQELRSHSLARLFLPEGIAE